MLHGFLALDKNVRKGIGFDLEIDSTRGHLRRCFATSTDRLSATRQLSQR